MAVDNNDVHNRLMQLEETDRKLSSDVSALNGRLDTALLTLTNNVNNLTNAIKALQESQALNNAIHQNLILLQERASSVPAMQAQINQLVVDRATTEVVLKGIRFVGAATLVAFIGLIVGAIWGIRNM